MATFTLSLKEDTAKRVKELTRYFGGSVPSFAAGLAEDFSRFPPDQIVRLRQQINATPAEKPRNEERRP